jgi:lipoprotein-releasing system ATP-binding protein
MTAALKKVTRFLTKADGAIRQNKVSDPAMILYTRLMPEPVFKCERVSKSYRAGSGEPIAVLRDISLRAGPGDTIGIIGPSGSGKSTLLHLLGALDKADSGSLTVLGQDLAALDAAALAGLRNRGIGFVFQAHHLLPQCTALENALMPALAAQNRVPPASAGRARELLGRVGLEDRMSEPAARLSGGERQRVALVRALVNRPALLLADEPTGSLDDVSSKAVADLLIELNQQERTTLVVVTHSLDLARRMGRVFRLQGGALTPAS